jgi:hypothetical protein
MFFQSAPCRSSLKKGTINVGHVVTSSVSQMILLLELKALCDVGFTGLKLLLLILQELCGMSMSFYLLSPRLGKGNQSPFFFRVPVYTILIYFD